MTVAGLHPDGRRFRRGVVFLLPLLLASRTSAQTALDEPPPLGSTFTVAMMADLPAGSSIYSLLDTAIPEVIADRIDAGGLLAGQAARVGARGSSWTQTTFELGDADITDPKGTGTPLLIPGLLAWERVDVATGLMPIELSAPGMAVSLEPRRPAASWTRTLAFSGASPSFMGRTALTVPPAIARQHAWNDTSIFLSGPILPGRLGIVATGSWTNSFLHERSDSAVLDSGVASAFAHLVYTPTDGDEIRTVGWAQRATYPQTNRTALGQPLATSEDRAVHGQLSWDHREPGGPSWTIFGATTARTHDDDLKPFTSAVIERLFDGPVPELLNPGTGTDTTWSVGGRLKPAEFMIDEYPQSVTVGVTFSGSRSTMRGAFSGRIGETVNGVPARVWDYTTPTTPSDWSEQTLVVYASDRFHPLPRLTFDAGLRFERVNGSALGSTSSVSWQNWLPRVSLRWALLDWGALDAIASFGRYGYRLPLSDLAYGDPSAPVANVYRWNATSAGADPQLQNVSGLISRMGPGTGGNPTFSGIDPQLRRPYLDEFVFGFESRPRAGSLYRIMAISRREKQLLGVDDVGVPESTYSVITVVDPIADKSSQGTVQAYNRSPSTFGADRYLLVNAPDNEATFIGVELSAQSTYKRFTYMIGGTAGRSEGLAADVGFTALENDQGVAGDVFIDPNARANAQGRLFTERGYTIKTAGTYAFPWDVHLGLAARYQDGQHFSRLIPVPGLNQGVEPVRAFRNGRTRFTYTATLDARLQKGVTVNGHHVVLMLDAYNLLNTGTEIEELQLTDARLTSALQPPRSIHAGLQLSF